MAMRLCCEYRRTVRGARGCRQLPETVPSPATSSVSAFCDTRIIGAVFVCKLRGPPTFAASSSGHTKSNSSMVVGVVPSAALPRSTVHMLKPWLMRLGTSSGGKKVQELNKCSY